MPTRAYPESGLAGHLFGYVGEINEAQLERSEFAGLGPGAVVGQTGVERVYNAKLMGEDGNRYVVVNGRFACRTDQVVLDGRSRSPNGPVDEPPRRRGRQGLSGSG